LFAVCHTCLGKRIIFLIQKFERYENSVQCDEEAFFNQFYRVDECVGSFQL
jgi:hypothetical protein